MIMTDYAKQLREVFGDDTVDKAIKGLAQHRANPSANPLPKSHAHMHRPAPDAEVTHLPSGSLYINIHEPVNPTDVAPETIVFVPGTGSTSRAWYPLLLQSKVQERYRVVLYDLEGHGRSPLLPDADRFQPGATWPSERWAQQLGEVIDHAVGKGTGKVWLVGFSMGGVRRQPSV